MHIRVQIWKTSHWIKYVVIARVNRVEWSRKPSWMQACLYSEFCNSFWRFESIHFSFVEPNDRIRLMSRIKLKFQNNICLPYYLQNQLFSHFCDINNYQLFDMVPMKFIIEPDNSAFLFLHRRDLFCSRIDCVFIFRMVTSINIVQFWHNFVIVVLIWSMIEVSNPFRLWFFTPVLWLIYFSNVHWQSDFSSMIDFKAFKIFNFPHQFTTPMNSFIWF